ncbi:MAG: NUDIX domain-containing protein [Planctomycetaceae bacterium]|nr:NUDIX domain-containing protein [Planctomycetaceae bacterium]
MKRIRRGARIVLLSPDRRFLLLHFAYTNGPLAGTDYWGVPGGGLEAGESPHDGAVRELLEETGIAADDLGPIRAVGEYDFRLMSGEDVSQHDWYFLHRVEEEAVLSRSGLTPEETATLAEARWWSLDELRTTRERVIPADLAPILAAWPEFETT